MSSTITVRGLPAADKSWLRREAQQLGCSMEALACRIIREKRERAQHSVPPSEVARRHFGAAHGVELSLHRGYGYRALTLSPSEE